MKQKDTAIQSGPAHEVLSGLEQRNGVNQFAKRRTLTRETKKRMKKTRTDKRKKQALPQRHQENQQQKQRLGKREDDRDAI